MSTAVLVLLSTLIHHACAESTMCEYSQDGSCCRCFCCTDKCGSNENITVVECYNIKCEPAMDSTVVNCHNTTCVSLESTTIVKCDDNERTKEQNCSELECLGTSTSISTSTTTLPTTSTAITTSMPSRNTILTILLPLLGSVIVILILTIIFITLYWKLKVKLLKERNMQIQTTVPSNGTHQEAIAIDPVYSVIEDNSTATSKPPPITSDTTLLSEDRHALNSHHHNDSRPMNNPLYSILEESRVPSLSTSPLHTSVPHYTELDKNTTMTPSEYEQPTDTLWKCLPNQHIQERVTPTPAALQASGLSHYKELDKNTTVTSEQYEQPTRTPGKLQISKSLLTAEAEDSTEGTTEADTYEEPADALTKTQVSLLLHGTEPCNSTLDDIETTPIHFNVKEELFGSDLHT